MTREEIENKFDIGLEISDGWIPLIEPILNYISEYNKSSLVHPIKIHQVKEKFGELRFYISHGPMELHEMIEDAEMKSCRICEICGELGKTRSRQGWLTTLCDNCAKNLGYD